MSKWRSNLIAYISGFVPELLTIKEACFSHLAIISYVKEAKLNYARNGKQQQQQKTILLSQKFLGGKNSYSSILNPVQLLYRLSKFETN